MLKRYDFAPLDGITRAVYRRVWFRRFGGADRCFIPFLSPTPQHVITPRDLRELAPEDAGTMPLVPQIMSRRAEDFLWAAETLGDMGFREVNLNLGCPSGTVTAKGKGSGFLREPEELDRFFDQVFQKTPLPVSVKTRLGYQTAEEFPALLEVFNRYPIACLTVHARVRPEKYRGALHMDAFRTALEGSGNPVCFNGDLQTVGGVRDLESSYPALEAVMIGRGAVADPALFRKLRGGPGAGRAELQAFTQELYREYQAFFGQVGTAAQRMREVWFYLIHLFEDTKGLNRKMRRFRSPGEYEAAEAAIFAELPLREDAAGALV